jgi:REP element-mobilizing transposase RayT
MDEHVYKSHNKTLLMYHLVFPVKYRRKVFTKDVEASLRDICLGIEQRYEIRFIEIGLEEDHVHFLIQSIPTMAVYEIVRTIKSLTGREIFRRHPKIKREILWGGALWTSGYYANTVGLYAGKETIRRYVENQGKTEEYTELYSTQIELDFNQ